MPPIKENLGNRKNHILRMSAYPSLRKSISFLALVSKIGVTASALFGLFTYGRLLSYSNLFLIPMVFIVFFSFLGWIMIRVTEQFLSAMIDGVDLKFLSDQRAENDQQIKSKIKSRE